MTAGLGHTPANLHHNHTLPAKNVDKSSDERWLEHFAKLPTAWQRVILRRLGGSGEEELEDLSLALSSQPRRSTSAVIAVDLLSRRKLTSRQNALLERLVDDYIDHNEARETWLASLRHWPIAIQVHHTTADLGAIDPHFLHLLTADDSTLLDEADRLAKAADAKHQSLISRGQAGVHPRDRDARSIRRRLRRKVGKVAIHAAAILRMIGGESGRAYADDWSLGRFRQVKAAGRAFLESHVAISEVTTDGEAPTGISMADIAESAAKAREAMWYAMILGMRDRANKVGFVPVFITATLPPRYHLNPVEGSDADRDVSISPTDAAKEISARWHRGMCLMREHGVRPFGVRVVEAHEDACPHLHAILWCNPDHRTAIERALRKQFPANGGSADAALKVKRWEDRAKRSGRGEKASDPASYVMKYVLKTVKADAAGGDSDVDSHDRAMAWAANVGLRRLSFVGLAQGTIGRWKAAQRALKTGKPLSCPRGRAIVHAMRRRQWSSALALLGAFCTKQAQRLIPWREKKLNRWGDTVQETRGWYHSETGEISLVARPHAWRIVGIDKLLSEDKLSISISYPRPGPSAPAVAALSPPDDPPGRAIAA